jgi:hypothetical protein
LHLRALHRFDDLVDKIITRCGVWVVEVKTCCSGLRGSCAPMYPSLESSPRWASFPNGWSTDGPLDELDLISFPLGLASWVQILEACDVLLSCIERTVFGLL